MAGIVIIPARGGSQRVPRKNVYPIDGVPMIARTINAVSASGVADAIVVTTDDVEIAQVASTQGAVVLQRPTELADHHTPLLPVMQSAISNLQQTGAISEVQQNVALVYATAITLDPGDLAQALSHTPTDSLVVSVTSFPHPPQRGFILNDEGTMIPIDRAALETRTQDLPQWWHDASQFVWGTAQTWLSTSSILEGALGFRVPHWRVVDLDTPEDLVRAEALVRVLTSLSFRQPRSTQD